MRWIIAGIGGGLVMFFWGAFSHAVLPLGAAGIKPVPNESAVVSTLKTNLNEPGFYFIPGMETNKTPTDEEYKAWEEKYKTGPTAILIYQPTGETPMSARQLLTELASNIFAALVVAYLLTLIAPSISKRVLASTLIGLTGWLSIMISYWNWYRFPTAVVLAEGFDQIFGWFLTGLAMALVLRRKEPLV